MQVEASPLSTGSFRKSPLRKAEQPPVCERRPLLGMVVQSRASSDSPTQLGDSDDERTSYGSTPPPWRIALSERKKGKGTLLDPAAVAFALRMALLLTASSLFVLIRGRDGAHYPDGMWVLVSVLFVCWFPSLDAASVIEKIMQRLIGTFVGAFLGLSCGFFSIAVFETRAYQATFLACCMLVGNFGIILAAGICKAGNKRVIRRYAYATILCVLTFCICMLPFGLEKDPKWELGVWRICNVIVGCILGALGAIVVCPKSTRDVLHDKTARQVKLAGEASEAVLQLAADLFAGKVKVNRLCDELMESPLETTVRWRMKRIISGQLSEASSKSCSDVDVALRKYEDAIADWNASKALFPLAKYDPFHMPIRDDAKSKDVQSEIAKTLARALRIQTTIVVLDGMIRSDTDYEFSEQELEMFEKTGELIHQMLTLPLSRVNDEAALELFDKLDQTRDKIMQLSNAVAKPEQSMEALRDYEMRKFRASLQEDVVFSDDDLGRGIPKFASGGIDNSLFFLQLVEHLILRTLRLFQAWKYVEIIPTNSDSREADDMESVRSLIMG